jgi:hypothetical protein
MIVPDSRSESIVWVRLCIWDSVCAGVAGWTLGEGEAAKEGGGVREKGMPGATGLGGVGRGG